MRIVTKRSLDCLSMVMVMVGRSVFATSKCFYLMEESALGGAATVPFMAVGDIVIARRRDGEYRDH